jgi:hypothetical protein
MDLRDFDVENFRDTVASVSRKVTIGRMKDLVLCAEGDLRDIFLDQFGTPDTKKIIKVIKDEPALITGELISVDDKCKNPRHCVVGALFYHAGMSNRRLKELQSRYGAGTTELPVWAHQMLWKHYRLTPVHTEELMTGNDDEMNAANTYDDDDDACTIVNKKALIDSVKKFSSLNEIDALTQGAKGIREFVQPFINKAYKEWVRLGVKAMKAETKEVRNVLTLKAAKKKVA